jgi:hypothetical protein
MQSQDMAVRIAPYIRHHALAELGHQEIPRIRRARKQESHADHQRVAAVEQRRVAAAQAMIHHVLQ